MLAPPGVVLPGVVPVVPAWLPLLVCPPEVEPPLGAAPVPVLWPGVEEPAGALLAGAPLSHPAMTTTAMMDVTTAYMLFTKRG
ncbi:MAG: hypothetical protein JO100_15500 [Pseudonocardia sp.]|nr:hypothetical protein [Pseudonocardia sp.]